VDQPAQWQEHPVDLVWSNLELHRHADPARLLRQWHAALRTDGLLLFSTWGPDTLRQLSWAWDEAQWGPAAQPWVDMHDWGDAMVEAGFDDPVMDQERITLTWADASSALRELRALGRNAHPQRFAACRGRQWRMAMTKALERCRAPDGRIALDFEVIYGHAVRGRERMPLAPETRISVESMRQSLRNRHR
jgi:malonyl-CoA O-methyltransferase